MKKIVYAVVVVSVLVLLLSSSASASLEISVAVKYPQIGPFQSQMITAETNERGAGIILVTQPAEGTPWIDFLNNHPLLEALWNSLPDSIRTQVSEKIGGKILSFEMISIGLGGGSEILTFPGDFTGINGEPSTALMGTYKVVFVFVSYEAQDLASFGQFSLLEVDFACGSWFVIPEVPLGTIMSLVSMVFALPVFKLCRRKRP